MEESQRMVRDFHRLFGLGEAERPRIPSEDVRKLRVRLIREEADELERAFDTGDIVGVADAVADLLYVVLEVAVVCGFDAEPIFHEVHRSNMAKVGGTLRSDGKWLKPPGWLPPDLAPLLRSQGAEGV